MNRHWTTYLTLAAYLAVSTALVHLHQRSGCPCCAAHSCIYYAAAGRPVSELPSWLDKENDHGERSPASCPFYLFGFQSSFPADAPPLLVPGEGIRVFAEKRTEFFQEKPFKLYYPRAPPVT